MAAPYSRCKKCSLAYPDTQLYNGICKFCQEAIQPDSIAIMEFNPLTPLLQEYEKELSE